MIINECAARGKQSVRQLAGLLGLSKSSVQRHRHAAARRARHPESPLWESEAGEAWLKIVVVAALYVFGLQCHVGAEKLSLFFKLLRVDGHIGVSPSALRAQMELMESLLPRFQQQCESAVSDESRAAVLAMDETFFGDFLILVLMDLSSGYVLLEEVAADRCFETWHRQAMPRLKALGIDVKHAVSDRAKALIKLAISGFACAAGADLFHAQQDISRWLGAKLGRRHAQAKTEMENARAVLSANTKPTIAEIEVVVDAELAYKQIDNACRMYHENLAGIAEDVHPFAWGSAQPQRAPQVAARLETRAEVFAAVAKKQGLADPKDSLAKFRRQVDDLAAHVEFWWQWVLEMLTEFGVDDATQQWLTGVLLPTVYWHRRQQMAHNPTQRQAQQKAWHEALQRLQTDAFTATLPEHEVQRWLQWAEWMVRQFHRSSSAVEGRNGYLSQMAHNGRGLSETRLRALTVIHNYGLKREDGTTAAMRLFGQPFPDLFSWLVAEMGALPLPRKRRARVVHNPLNFKSVPA